MHYTSTPDHQQMRPKPRVAVSILTLVLVTSCDGHYGQRDAKQIDGVVSLPAGMTAVRITVPSGNVSVEPSADERISYEAEVQRSADTAEQLAALVAIEPRLRATTGTVPGQLEITGATLPKELDPRQAWISYRMLVKVPKSLRVELVLGDGHGSIIGMQGGASIETGHGILLLKRCLGDARLRSGKGDLTIDSHRGGIDAETGTGKIVAFVDEVREKGVRLVSGNGGIQAHLPRDAAFTLDMRAPEGKLDATWQLPIKREHGGVFMAGAVGGGGPLVYIESLTGSVSLRAEVPTK